MPFPQTLQLLFEWLRAQTPNFAQRAEPVSACALMAQRDANFKHRTPRQAYVFPCSKSFRRARRSAGAPGFTRATHRDLPHPRRCSERCPFVILILMPYVRPA